MKFLFLHNIRAGKFFGGGTTSATRAESNVEKLSFIFYSPSKYLSFHRAHFVADGLYNWEHLSDVSMDPVISDKDRGLENGSRTGEKFAHATSDILVRRHYEFYDVMLRFSCSTLFTDFFV
jgi:hypothetical protein